MTANPPEVAFILISSHEMEDAWRDLFLSCLATVISWFETNLSIVSDGFCCIVFYLIIYIRGKNVALCAHHLPVTEGLSDALSLPG